MLKRKKFVFFTSILPYAPKSSSSLPSLSSLPPTLPLLPPPPYSSPNPSPRKIPHAGPVGGTRCKARGRRRPKPQVRPGARNPSDSTIPATPPERTRTAQRRRCSRASRPAPVHFSGTGEGSPASGYARRSAA